MSMNLKPGTRYSTLVTFEVHQEVPLSDVKDFIVEWLESGGGCRHPDDPLFNSLTRVKVSYRRPQDLQQHNLGNRSKL